MSAILWGLKLDHLGIIVIPAPLVHMVSLSHTYAQGVEQSVLSVIVIITKIAKSQVLRICASCNYHKLVDIGKNWFLCASN